MLTKIEITPLSDTSDCIVKVVEGGVTTRYRAAKDTVAMIASSAHTHLIYDANRRTGDAEPDL